jgi:hypothetical protein
MERGWRRCDYDEILPPFSGLVMEGDLIVKLELPRRCVIMGFHINQRIGGKSSIL